MKKSKIVVTGSNQNGQLRLYINNSLHCLLDYGNNLRMQAWIEDAGKYHIEFYFEQGCPVLLQYSTVDKWLAVLKKLDQLL